MKHVLLESITETEADGYYFGQFKSMDPITLMGTLDEPISLSEGTYKLEMNVP